MSSILEAKDLHKIYENGAKRLEVLKGIDLEIETGNIVSILGPSGAGKSTLLHILGGLDNPTQGEILLKGKNLYQMPDRELSSIRNKFFGFVFQFYHLLGEFSALENVCLPALVTNHGLEKVRKIGKAGDMLDLVGLKERSQHLPSQLSGGEQQRLAIARALMNTPEILFCDEPTGNLDSQNGRAICELLLKLNQQKNMTIVIVTHQKEVAGIAHKQIHIYDGRIDS